MPKTKFQEIVFTILMVLVMVYAMICYNISIGMGEVNNKVFIMAFGELYIMAVIAFILEHLFIGKIVNKIVFNTIDTNNTQPIVITLMISAITVCFMCPIMSLIASILFNYNGFNNIVSTWLLISIRNFPMALCWQLFYAGPFVRGLFRIIFKRQLEA